MVQGSLNAIIAPRVLFPRHAYHPVFNLFITTSSLGFSMEHHGMTCKQKRESWRACNLQESKTFGYFDYSACSGTSV
jgi:hypothetical protein